MASIFGAVLAGALAVWMLLGAAGLPVGAFVLGGRERILAGRKRAVAAGAAVLALFAGFCVLCAGGEIPGAAPGRSGTGLLSVFCRMPYGGRAFPALLEKLEGTHGHDACLRARGGVLLDYGARRVRNFLHISI